MNSFSLVLARKFVTGCLQMASPGSCLVCSCPSSLNRVCHRCALETPDTSLAGRCLTCFGPALERPVCHYCSSNPLHFHEVRYLWDYRGNLRDVVQAMKYSPSLWLAKFLSKRAAPFPLQLFSRPCWDCIVPVPSSKVSLRQRGFNQSTVIAEAVSRNIRQATGNKIPVKNRILFHRGYRARQVSLPHSQRYRNVKDAFSTRGPSPERILLIDDVVTTGSTVSAACAALRRAGAHTIDVFALARSESWYEFRQQLLLPKQRLESIGP
ncbi:MAG: hypothetical protein DCC75_02210 [Proteobacteria bacterium]|nr:MAG: hypothetical protein DCC75_02210 [Pseudomonadota bacterium]